jgi:hypothetical protein
MTTKILIFVSYLFFLAKSSSYSYLAELIDLYTKNMMKHIASPKNIINVYVNGWLNSSPLIVIFDYNLKTIEEAVLTSIYKIIRVYP